MQARAAVAPSETYTSVKYAREEFPRFPKIPPAPPKIKSASDHPVNEGSVLLLQAPTAETLRGTLVGSSGGRWGDAGDASAWREKRRR